MNIDKAKEGCIKFAVAFFSAAIMLYFLFRVLFPAGNPLGDPTVPIFFIFIVPAAVLFISYVGLLMWEKFNPNHEPEATRETPVVATRASVLVVKGSTPDNIADTLGIIASKIKGGTKNGEYSGISWQMKDNSETEL